jgi:hypothetical protein
LAVKRILAVILIVFFGAVALASGQTANDAYLALKKMEAKTQVGISQLNYAPALAETKFAVERYLESKEAKKTPELNKHLDKALTAYLHAKDIFDVRSDGDTPFIDTLKGELVRKVYPKVISYPSHLEGTPREGAKYYKLPEVISGLWGEASKEIKKASFYLNN